MKQSMNLNTITVNLNQPVPNTISHTKQFTDKMGSYFSGKFQEVGMNPTYYSKLPSKHNIDEYDFIARESNEKVISKIKNYNSNIKINSKFKQNDKKEDDEDFSVVDQLISDLQDDNRVNSSKYS